MPFSNNYYKLMPFPIINAFECSLDQSMAAQQFNTLPQNPGF